MGRKVLALWVLVFSLLVLELPGCPAVGLELGRRQVWTAWS